MPTGQQIYEKYCNGDTLSNAEILYGATAFRAAYEANFDLGPVWKLAALEALRHYDNFKGFAIARGIWKEAK